MTPTPLVGRDREIAVLDDLFRGMPERGGALVVRGEAGIGKSSILNAAGVRARERGMQVLTTSGVQAESHLPFAALQMLLRPILAGVEDLPAPQRTAVQAAFGMTDAVAPNPFLIALATLDLLADSAARAPLLLLIEDAQWGDRSSCNVLTFVARRLASEPIVQIFAVRDGFESPLNQMDFPELRLDRLDEAAAGELLDSTAPGLSPRVRARLLEEAVGNPLALVELPAALDSKHLGGDLPLPTWLPLSTRLERAFTARIADLPADTRTLLVVAAMDDGGALTEVLTATGAVLGDSTLTTDILQPAIDARLIAVEDMELRFRHPLVRSAVRQAASLPQRQAAHTALADLLADQLDRRAWHRAAASVGPNEEAAADLEAAATRAQRRGAIAVAVAALERASSLSGTDDDRSRRLLRGAELAFELGRQDAVARFVREAEPLKHTAIDQGRLAWITEMIDPRPPGDPDAVRSLAETGRRMCEAGDIDLGLRLLLAAAGRCSFADPGDDIRQAIVAASEQVGLPEDEPRLLAITVSAAPLGRGRIVLDRLSRWVPEERGDAEAMYWLATAAANAGAYDRSASLYAAAIDGLRAHGRLGLLARALIAQAWSEALLGWCTRATPIADEGSRLAHETGQTLVFARGRAVEAFLAGLRGEADLVDDLAAEAEQIARPMRATTVLATAQLARAMTALGAGQYTAAYECLWPLFDPAVPSNQYARRSGAIGDLAEAAVYSGHLSDLRMLLNELEPQVSQSVSPWFQAGLSYARALAADDAVADALFQAALQSDLSRWPLIQARLQLAYGARLRRQRRIADSRPLLRAARDLFDSLGAIPWSERARLELRASGESSRRAPAAREQLSPQELQIAQLAADGLSNREIGQRLYLSHRTVGSHLYRIFPKLGITGRAELRTALDTARSTENKPVTNR